MGPRTAVGTVLQSDQAGGQAGRDRCAQLPSPGPGRPPELIMRIVLDYGDDVLRGIRFAAVPATVAFVALLAASCASTAPSRAGSGTRITVVAAENFWGSIAAQLGGARVQVHSLITSPNTDPHAYEPTPADARTIAEADFVIENGIGYDPWASKMLAADPTHGRVLDVGRLLGARDGGNPHFWYDPADVQRVIEAITAAYRQLDPADRAYFTARSSWFTSVALSRYHSLISTIRAEYAGTPVGASESIFSMLAPSLGLDLVTPSSFLTAISEGTDVSSADKQLIDSQITTHRIKIYIYNSQNTTPDVQVQLHECRNAGIPTATITETLDPAGDTYQAWQVSELLGIQRALRKATGH